MIKIRGNSIKIRIPHCFTTTLQGNLKLWDECLTWKCKRLLRESERSPQPDRSLLRLLLLFLVMLWWWYLLLWLSRWTVLVGECRLSEGFRRPPTRQEGPSPSWPVGGRRKPSDGLPPARRDTSLRGRCPSPPVGRTQLPLSHKQTSSDPTRRFRQFYD